MRLHVSICLRLTDGFDFLVLQPSEKSKGFLVKGLRISMSTCNCVLEYCDYFEWTYSARIIHAVNPCRRFVRFNNGFNVVPTFGGRARPAQRESNCPCCCRTTGPPVSRLGKSPRINILVFVDL